MSRVFLLRYDTEAAESEPMRGFLEKVVAVHRAHAIPATFFCRGGAVEARRSEFRDFGAEVRNDPLFDLQDHSYSHIGLGYEAGRPLEELRADYERSFAVHADVFGKRPFGTSICGTGGRDGKRLEGFDATEKSRAEFAMIAGMGVRMINSFLKGADESRDFVNYAALGYPGIMGFPSGFSDTSKLLEKLPDGSWRRATDFDVRLRGLMGEIAERSHTETPMPVILHDWAAWNFAGGRELDHAKRLVDTARAQGYRLATHAQCLDWPELWGAWGA